MITVILIGASFVAGVAFRVDPSSAHNDTTIIGCQPDHELKEMVSAIGRRVGAW